MDDIPEVSPIRFDVTDVKGFKQHLAEHGYACVKEAATPAQLEHARELFWQHLEGKDCPLQRQRRPVGWKRDDVTTWKEGHGDGLMTSTTHCDAMWYVRTLPGVCGAFAAAYECTTEDIVAAYDRMSVNLPTSSGNEAALRVASRSFEHGKLNAQELHTHFNQDGYGDELICYAIMPLWDMNKAGGATAIVPGSHLKVKEIEEHRRKNWAVVEKADGSGKERKWVGTGRPEEDMAQYTELGLTPCVTNVIAGDLVLFDTALYHAGCPAEDPSGLSSHGPDHLLRAICILSMAPTRLLTDFWGKEEAPALFRARRRAYEMDEHIGGSCMTPRGPGVSAERFFERDAQGDFGQGNVRNFKDAPEKVRKIIDPFWTPETDLHELAQAQAARL